MTHNSPKWRESTYVIIFLTLPLAGACNCNLRSVLQVSHISSIVPRSIQKFWFHQTQGLCTNGFTTKSTHEKDTSFQLNEKDTFDLYTAAVQSLLSFCSVFSVFLDQCSTFFNSMTSNKIIIM